MPPARFAGASPVARSLVRDRAKAGRSHGNRASANMCRLNRIESSACA